MAQSDNLIALTFVCHLTKADKGKRIGPTGGLDDKWAISLHLIVRLIIVVIASAMFWPQYWPAFAHRRGL
jgi:hypothetical protein